MFHSNFIVKTDSDRFHVGLIVPSSNTTMEPDFHRAFGSRGVVSTTRIFLEQVTREAELKMLEEDLPQAIRLIRTTTPDVIVFGCTSAGSLDGLEHDAAIARRMEVETGAKAVTVVGSVLAALRAARANRVAVFTPYTAELTRSVTDCVISGGYSVVHSTGMGIVSNREIGAVTPDQIIQFVDSQIKEMEANADCLFLSCTNWQAVPAIGRLREKHGIPIITSNQATIDAVIQAGGIPAA